MKFTYIDTVTVNKWWDSLKHETKLDYVKRMNTFNWKQVICLSAISKNQKNELYQQVHNLNNKKLHEN